MKKIYTAIAALVLCASPAVGKDVWTYDQFLRVARENDATQMWLSTTGQGLLVAQSIYKRNGYPYLYCQPAQMAIAPAQYIEILAGYIDRHGRGREQFDMGTASVLLVNALEETFPCQE
jgi:hypothetical protein